MKDELNLTYYSDEEFFDLLESSEFKDRPADEIFAYLSQKVKLNPFYIYLKRLIYRKAGFNGNMEDIDEESYRDFIVASFRSNGVPASMKSATTKVSAAAKNWLKSAAVSRETVFLIGFGLKLTSVEVSELLAKGLNESKIYYRNSFEAICSYCYDNNLPYSKMKELSDKYSAGSEKLASNAIGTIQIEALLRRAMNDEELISIIKKHRLDPGNFFSHTAREEFDRLYNDCSSIISERKGFEDDEWDISAFAVKGKLTTSIRNKLKGKPVVNSSDIEKALNTGTPIDNNGNLITFSRSSLCDAFRQKRMTRNHISDILLGKEPVDRFDLITMQFFVSSYTDCDKRNNERWYRFVENCNRMLAECSMGQLYNANPYDVFLQMCMLTDVPMVTYDDILEMSYQ